MTWKQFSVVYEEKLSQNNCHSSKKDIREIYDDILIILIYYVLLTASGS